MASEFLSSSRTREDHIRTGRYLKDVIYAANDGIVTTFAVVAATVGGSLSPATILIVGIANLFADGLSMAGGNYLGTRSEKDFYDKEALEEKKEIKIIPEQEKQEIRDILAAKGYSGADLDQLVLLIASNEQFWVDFMMQEELNLYIPDTESALKNAVITFFSFAAAGSIPLLPYLVYSHGASFMITSVVSGIALFGIGAARAYFSQRSWVMLGLEMFVVGGSSAAIAYGIGFFLNALI